VDQAILSQTLRPQAFSVSCLGPMMRTRSMDLSFIPLARVGRRASLPREWLSTPCPSLGRLHGLVPAHDISFAGHQRTARPAGAVTASRAPAVRVSKRNPQPRLPGRAVSRHRQNPESERRKPAGKQARTAGISRLPEWRPPATIPGGSDEGPGVCRPPGIPGGAVADRTEPQGTLMNVKCVAAPPRIEERLHP
jgi:hypothetical protein